MKRFTVLITSFFLALSFFALAPIKAQAQVPVAWSGNNGCTGAGEAEGVATIQGAQCLVSNVFSVAITFIGLAAFVMLIVGSFGYMLSGGNSKGTETARNTITFAVVGIVVALSAFVILNFISSFTGVDEVIQFQIPGAGNGGTDPFGESL